MQPQSKNNNTMLEISFDLFAQNMQKYTRYSHTNHCKHKKNSGMYISHLDGRRIQSSCRQDRGGVAGGGRPDVAVVVAAVTEDCSMDQRGEACGLAL